jgi:hypothetical protein
LAPHLASSHYGLSILITPATQFVRVDRPARRQEIIRYAKQPPRFGHRVVQLGLKRIDRHVASFDIPYEPRNVGAKRQILALLYLQARPQPKPFLDSLPPRPNPINDF